eukprot:COSAG06_NODE_56902_length_282_cov_1.398907_1_plen_30_part_10
MVPYLARTAARTPHPGSDSPEQPEQEGRRA